MSEASLEARFHHAFEAEERGKIEQAAALYEQNVADAEPGTMLWCQSLYRRAYCLERLGSHDAEPAYLRLLERCPERSPLLPESCFRLGWLRERAGDRDAAAAWYRRIADCVEAAPAVRANGAFRLAFSLEVGRQHAEAAEEYQRALDAEPEEPLRSEALFRLAFCRELGGRIADAIEIYERLLHSPACADALRAEAAYRLAESQESVGLLTEARDRLRWIVDQAPHARRELREISRYRLGLLLMAMDDDTVLELWQDRDALDAIEIGVARKAALALGCYLQRRRRYELAEEVFRSAAPEGDRSPIGAEVLFRRRQCLLKLGRDGEAGELLERLRNHPNVPPDVQARLQNPRDEERRPGSPRHRTPRWRARRRGDRFPRPS